VAPCALAALIALPACGDSDTDADSGDDKAGAVQTDRVSDSGQSAATDSKGGTSTGTSTGTAPDRPTPRDRLVPGLEVEPGSDEEQVLRMIHGLYANIAGTNREAFCARISREARREMARQTPGTGDPDVVCEQVFVPFLRAAVRDGLRRSLKAEVHAIDIDGDRGTITLGFGDDRREIPVVRESGRWKLAARDS
jgi:hypothetical protein